MRNKFVIANWKMNGSKELIFEYSKFLRSVDILNRDLMVAVPYIYLDFAKKEIGDMAKICSQDIHNFPDGAFTGGVSAKMLKDIEVDWSIIGHNETRSQNCDVSKKISNAVESKVNFILCIGDESQDLVVNKKYINAVLSKELLPNYNNIDKNNLNFYIAYEPIWSIGTGKVAGMKYIEEVFNLINEFCLINFNKKINLIYGGSVNENNYLDIINLDCINGILVGGASLKINTLKRLLTFNSLLLE